MIRKILFTLTVISLSDFAFAMDTKENFHKAKTYHDSIAIKSQPGLKPGDAPLFFDINGNKIKYFYDGIRFPTFHQNGLKKTIYIAKNTYEEYDDKERLVKSVTPDTYIIYDYPSDNDSTPIILLYASIDDQKIEEYAYYQNNFTVHLIKKLIFNPETDENTLILYDDKDTEIFKGVYKGNSLIDSLVTQKLNNASSLSLIQMRHYFPTLKSHLTLTDIIEIKNKLSQINREVIKATQDSITKKNRLESDITKYFNTLTKLNLSYEEIVKLCDPDADPEDILEKLEQKYKPSDKK